MATGCMINGGVYSPQEKSGFVNHDQLVMITCILHDNRVRI